MQTTTLIFVIDPMCSWCWGFAPILETLRKEHQEKYTFSLLIGGLRQSMPWNAQSKSYLKHNWDAITQRTSQKFTYTLLNQSHFTYNTYPSCKAVLTLRELWGEAEAFEYLHNIQEAFYTQGKDITNIDILTEYIKEDKEQFLAFYHSPKAEILMQKDFAKVRSMGINSFPSTIKIDEERNKVILSGYREIDEIIAF